MNIRFRVPSTVSSPTEIRRLLALAESRELAPLDPKKRPAVETVSVSVALKPTSLTWATSLAETTSQPLRVILEGLVHAAVAHEKTLQPIHRPNPMDELRKRFAESLDFITRNGRIGLLEGSTGIGKTRLIIAAACRAIEEGKTNAFIAVPTVQNALHFLAEWGLATSAPAPSLVLGRRQFVDDCILRKHVAAGKPDEVDEGLWGNLVAWVQSGGRGPLATALTDYVGHHYAWLAEDFDALVPGISSDEFLLSPADGPDAESSEAHSIYQRGRTSALDDKIVILTHAMLCTGVMQLQYKRPPILPDIDALFVDEAHLLEGAMASMASRDISFSVLRALLRELQLDDALATCQAIIRDTYQMFGRRSDVARIYSSTDTPLEPQWDRFRDQCRKLHADLVKKSSRKRKSISPENKAALDDYADILRSIIEDKESLWLHFSPQYHLPSLMIGPASVGTHMKRLWDLCGSAALVSATLYLPYIKGPSAQFTAYKLWIPTERISYFEPVIAPHILGTPILHRVAEGDPDFTYPSSKEENLESLIGQWRENIACLLLHTILPQAKGGSLVLCRSYADLNALRDFMVMTLGERLIAQNPRKSWLDLQAQFRELHRAGKRPVFLGAGKAWTGLEFVDHEVPPEQDFLLTDLIITRLPYNSNRTPCAEFRRLRSPASDLYETAFILKQGLGRLIRREGVTDRNIWYLDARKTRSKRHASELVLEAYSKKKIIAKDDRCAGSFSPVAQ
jgi:ATP-dependent DNA helicase DinG